MRGRLARPAESVAFAGGPPGPGLTGHVTMAYYDGGHVTYIGRASHRKLEKDAAFFAKAIGSRSDQRARPLRR